MFRRSGGTSSAADRPPPGGWTLDGANVTVYGSSPASILGTAIENASAVASVLTTVLKPGPPVNWARRDTVIVDASTPASQPIIGGAQNAETRPVSCAGALRVRSWSWP